MKTNERSFGDLAKLAGIELPVDCCSQCGRTMEKRGAVNKCACGMMKKAGVGSALVRAADVVRKPMGIVPLSAMLGGAGGAALGAAGAGEGNRIKGGLIGGTLGAATGGLATNPIVKHYVEDKAGDYLAAFPKGKQESVLRGLLNKRRKEFVQQAVLAGSALGGAAGALSRPIRPREKELSGKEEAEAFYLPEFKNDKQLVPTLRSIGGSIGGLALGLPTGALLGRMALSPLAAKAAPHVLGRQLAPGVANRFGNLAGSLVGMSLGGRAGARLGSRDLDARYNETTRDKIDAFEKWRKEDKTKQAGLPYQLPAAVAGGLYGGLMGGVVGRKGRLPFDEPSTRGMVQGGLAGAATGALYGYSRPSLRVPLVTSLLGSGAGYLAGRAVPTDEEKRKWEEAAQLEAEWDRDSDRAPMLQLPEKQAGLFSSKHTEEDGSVVTRYPISRGGPASSLPAAPTSPHLTKALLPQFKVSPTIGLSATGVQLGCQLRRRPNSIPKDSVVGKGLDNQNVTGGATIRVETALDKARRKLDPKDTEKQDFLMGHEKLNPEVYRPADTKKVASVDFLKLAMEKLALSPEVMLRANAARQAQRNAAFEESFMGGTRRAYEVAQNKLMRNQALTEARMGLKGLGGAVGKIPSAVPAAKGFLRRPGLLLGGAALGAYALGHHLAQPKPAAQPAMGAA